MKYYLNIVKIKVKYENNSQYNSALVYVELFLRINSRVLYSIYTLSYERLLKYMYVEAIKKDEGLVWF